MLCRVSSITFDRCSTLLFTDASSKEALIRICSPRSDFALTLIASRPEDVFIDLIANSFLGATMYQKRSKLPSVSCLHLYRQYWSFRCQSFH